MKFLFLFRSVAMPAGRAEHMSGGPIGRAGVR
jgi:hypothetical protein